MEEFVSVAEANHRFTELLRGVQKGLSYVITLRRRPIARLIPVATDERSREVARSALLVRLKTKPAAKRRRRWTRSEMYKDQ
jgi:prevent-host-death family protein